MGKEPQQKTYIKFTVTWGLKWKEEYNHRNFSFNCKLEKQGEKTSGQWCWPSAVLCSSVKEEVERDCLTELYRQSFETTESIRAK